LAARICIVGQAPNQKGGAPIEGRLGKALAAMLGITPAAFYERTVRVNLNAEWTGKRGKGDAFDADEGHMNALRIAFSPKTKMIVCLGRAVGKCFGFTNEKFLSVGYMGGKFFLLFPHPSGINRWFNSAANRRRAARALKRFCDEGTKRPPVTKARRRRH
jgi:uracil-DNA glycosylase